MTLGHIRQSMYLCKSKYVGFFYYQKTGGLRIMSSDLSFFEQMGGTYTEKDGFLYPNLLTEQETEHIEVGKYGLVWISFMKEKYPDRYRHHIRMGQLQGKAAEVNEEAYEMLEIILEKYLKKHKLVNSNSTMEMWNLREQAKQIAEEEVYETVVYRFH